MISNSECSIHRFGTSTYRDTCSVFVTVKC